MGELADNNQDLIIITNNNINQYNQLEEIKCDKLIISDYDQNISPKIICNELILSNSNCLFENRVETLKMLNQTSNPEFNTFSYAKMYEFEEHDNYIYQESNSEKVFFYSLLHLNKLEVENFNNFLNREEMLSDYGFVNRIFDSFGEQDGVNFFYVCDNNVYFFQDKGDKLEQVEYNLGIFLDKIDEPIYAKDEILNNFDDANAALFFIKKFNLIKDLNVNEILNNGRSLFDYCYSEEQFNFLKQKNFDFSKVKEFNSNNIKFKNQIEKIIILNETSLENQEKSNDKRINITNHI